MSKQGPAIPRELAQEIARQAESRLQSTKDIAGITVARATTLCGIFGAAAIALAAAVLAYLGVNDHETRLVAAGALTAVILLLAAGLAALAGASRKFRVAGCDPIELRKWCWDAQSATWRSEEELFDAIGQKLAPAIEANRDLLAREGRLVNISLGVALAAVVFGLLTYFVWGRLPWLW